MNGIRLVRRFDVLASRLARCSATTTISSHGARRTSHVRFLAVRNNGVATRCFSHNPKSGDELLDDLCRKHMDLPAQDFAIGCSFLHQIALGIPVDDIDKLLSDLPSLVNFRDYDRRTPLHIASSEGHLDICKLLLSRGAKINRSDRWGLAPLDDAHRHQHGEIVQVSFEIFLMDNVLQNSYFALTPLHFAILLSFHRLSIA